jgi:hypothetical protein
MLCLTAYKFIKPLLYLKKMHVTPPELLYSGPKIFVDAAWKKRANGQPSKAGVGIHIT